MPINHRKRFYIFKLNNHPIANSYGKTNQKNEKHPAEGTVHHQQSLKLFKTAGWASSLAHVRQFDPKT